MGQCKLCLQEKELRRSHIIPEFMYSRIYDKDPRRFYAIKGTPDSVSSKIEQKGKREYLLCDECETKLSKNEKYADETLNGKNQNSTARLVDQSFDPVNGVFLYEFEGVDFDKMKLFFDSLLWRLIVSDSFNTPQYSEAIVEKLRLSVYSERPLNYDEFPCAMQFILTAPGKTLEGFITTPIEKSHENGTRVLSILIDGMEFNFYIEGELANEAKSHFLNTNGDLRIVGRFIYDMPELINIIKPRMDHLRKRLEKGKQ